MRPKASIRKQGGCWVLVRPLFGFTLCAEVTLHATWRDARRALLGTGVGSASPITERAAGYRSWIPSRHARGPVPVIQTTPDVDAT